MKFHMIVPIFVSKDIAKEYLKMFTNVGITLDFNTETDIKHAHYNIFLIEL